MDTQQALGTVQSALNMMGQGAPCPPFQFQQVIEAWNHIAAQLQPADPEAREEALAIVRAADEKAQGE